MQTRMATCHARQRLITIRPLGYRKETMPKSIRIQVRLAAESLRLGEIDRVCGRYELESDEFYTLEQKAERYITGRR